MPKNNKKKKNKINSNNKKEDDQNNKNQNNDEKNKSKKLDLSIIEKNNENNNNNIFQSNHDLPFFNYYIKNIIGDGNCYYRCLSYFYRGTENYHLEFRKLICDLFANNINKFITSYPDPSIIGENEPTNEQEVLIFLEKYVEYIRNPGVYAGDQEISLTSYFFGININILIQEVMCYKSIYFYHSVVPTEQVINILYRDGNHYDLLFKSNNNNESIEIDKDIINNSNKFFKELNVKIEKNKKNYLKKMLN